MIEHVILKMIDELKATPKTNDKRDIISKFYNSHSEDGLCEFFELALCPRRLFYVVSLSKIPETTAPSEVRTDVTTEYVLDKLYQSKNRKETMSTLIECLNYGSAITRKIIDLILAKDLDCGVGISIVNKALGFKLIDDFEVAKAEEHKHISAFENYQKFFWNLKVDGQRLIVLGNIHNEFRFLSSSGKEIVQLYHTKLGQEIKDITHLYLMQYNKKSVCFDAELLGVDESGKELERRKSNGICTKMQNMNATPEEVQSMRAWIFDVIGYDTEELIYQGTSKPQFERLYELNSIKEQYRTKSEHLIFLPYHIVESVEQLMTDFKNLVSNGFEGLIAKKYDAPYEIKRQKHWVKLKKEVEIDVIVTGWTRHKKRDDMIGALLIESACGRIKGSIGTGTWLTEAKRLELRTRALNGTLEGTILEICVMEIAKNKKNDDLSFYLPRITREREDKTIADDYEKIMSMF